MAIDRIVASTPAARERPAPFPALTPPQGLSEAEVWAALDAAGPARAAADTLADAGPRTHAGEQAGTRAGAQVDAQPAMRVDQSAMAHRFQRAAPDAATLGAAWRVMVRTASMLAATLRDQGRGQHMPGGLFGNAQAPSALRELPAQPADPEPWRFPVYAWEYQRMMLSIVEREDHRGDTHPQRQQGTALRLDLILPGLGHVAVQMLPGAHGILLELAAQQDEGLQHLRALLPQLAGVIGGAGLAIARCRLVRSLGGARAEVPLASQAAALPFALYKAMAGVAMLLAGPPGGAGAGAKANADAKASAGAKPSAAGASAGDSAGGAAHWCPELKLARV